MQSQLYSKPFHIYLLTFFLPFYAIGSLSRAQNRTHLRPRQNSSFCPSAQCLFHSSYKFQGFQGLKGARSRLVHLEKFSLNF